MFISKGSYGYGEPKNANALSVQLTHWAFRMGNHPVSCTACWSDNGNVGNLEDVDRNGTLFAPKQSLYQKVATGMENLKMQSFVCAINALGLRAGK